MKKFAAFILVICMALSLSSCGRSRRYPNELVDLGLSPSLGTINLKIDSRRGIHKKGILRSVIKISNDIEFHIKEDPRWVNFPLDEQIEELLLRDVKDYKDFNKLLPPVRNGYFIFLDQHLGKQKEDSEFREYHFIFAIYEPVNQLIYYCEVDI